MQMVWHDDECVRLDGRKALGQFLPGPADHPARLVQAHAFVADFAEKAESFLHGDGYEVGARLGVVIRLETE